MSDPQPNLPRPRYLKIRPMSRGINSSMPSCMIDRREMTDTMNTRFDRQQINTVPGFKLKYDQLPSHALWIDTLTVGANEVIIAITDTSVYTENNGSFEVVPALKTAGGGTLTLAGNPSVSPVLAAVGSGQYTTHTHGGSPTLIPSSGMQEFLAFTNGVNGTVIIFNDSGWVGEQITGHTSGSRAVAFFDNRLIIGGTDASEAEIAWSSRGKFGDFTSIDSGTEILGDGPDRIQALMNVGEYLMVYKERSTWIGRKSFVSDPAIVFDALPGQGIGLAAPMSIGDLGTEQIILGSDDVYAISTKGIENLTKNVKEELFYGKDGILPKYIHSSIGVIAEEFDEYWLFVPTGKWPNGPGAGDGVFNVLLNPDFVLGSPPTSWTQVGGISLSSQSGGDYGGKVIRAGCTGTTDGFEQTYNFNESLEDRSFVLTARVRSSVASKPIQVKLLGLNVAGTAIENKTVDVILRAENMITANTWEWVTATKKMDNALTEQVQCYIVTNAAGAVDLECDCVHLCEITGVDEVYLSSVGATSSNRFLSIIGPNEGEGKTNERIRFIKDYIGQWMPDTAWIFNYRHNSWTKRRLPITGLGFDKLSASIKISDLIGNIEDQNWRFDERLATALAPTNLIGKEDGQVYEVSKVYSQMWQGSADSNPEDSEEIYSVLESKDFDLDSPEFEKYFTRLIILHDNSVAAAELPVGLSVDGGTSWTEASVTLRTGYPLSWVDFNQRGNQLRFRIESSKANYQISGFILKWIPGGESNDYTTP